MRICIHKATKRILEMQSHATEGTLTQNALSAGYLIDDIEEKVVDTVGYQVALSEDPVEIARLAAEAAAQVAAAQKSEDFIANLPSWQQVSDAIDAATTIAACKVILKKLARVVYWLAKNTKD